MPQFHLLSLLLQNAPVRVASPQGNRPSWRWRWNAIKFAICVLLDREHQYDRVRGMNLGDDIQFWNSLAITKIGNGSQLELMVNCNRWQFATIETPM